MIRPKMLLIALTGLLVTIVGASLKTRDSDSYCVPRKVSPDEQHKIFNRWVHEFYVVRDIPTAFHKYVVQDFIQHNPDEPPHGALPSQLYLTKLFGNMTYGVEILHQGFDNGIGWVHWRLDYYLPRPIATADIFRFNESCIEEHWDVIEELPANATNPIALF